MMEIQIVQIEMAVIMRTVVLIALANDGTLWRRVSEGGEHWGPWMAFDGPFGSDEMSA